MKNCDSFQGKLGAYVVGGLDQAEREAVQRHLATCRHCAAEVQALEQVGRMLDEMEPAEPPPFMWSRLRQELLAQQASNVRPWWKAFWAWPRPLYLGLATALVVLALVFFLPTESEPVVAEGTSPAPYVARHHLAAWNDPLHDKVLAGLWLAEGP